MGIPTVLDRFIQQAVLQVLQCSWDQTFSEQSYGFRPSRSAHQAVAQAQAYIAQGYGYVVDIDLEKFFDRVNHDILMSLVAKRVQDKRLLKLLRAYSECRSFRRWSGESNNRRDAARRAVVAAVVQPDVGRSG